MSDFKEGQPNVSDNSNQKENTTANLLHVDFRVIMLLHVGPCRSLKSETNDVNCVAKNRELRVRL